METSSREREGVRAAADGEARRRWARRWRARRRNAARSGSWSSAGAARRPLPRGPRSWWSLWKWWPRAMLHMQCMGTCTCTRFRLGSPHLTWPDLWLSIRFDSTAESAHERRRLISSRLGNQSIKVNVCSGDWRRVVYLYNNLVGVKSSCSRDMSMSGRKRCCTLDLFAGRRLGGRRASARRRVGTLRQRRSGRRRLRREHLQRKTHAEEENAVCCPPRGTRHTVSCGCVFLCEQTAEHRMGRVLENWSWGIRSYAKMEY